MMRIAADLIARRKPTDCSENLRLNGHLGRHLPEVSRRRTAAIPPSLFLNPTFRNRPLPLHANFVCRCPASPTWTNFIPVVKTHQTQADARERRLVGSSVTRQRQDAKSSCPATESGVSSTDIWPVRALHPITRQRRRSCWPATWSGITFT